MFTLHGHRQSQSLERKQVHVWKFQKVLARRMEGFTFFDLPGPFGYPQTHVLLNVIKPHLVLKVKLLSNFEGDWNIKIVDVTSLVTYKAALHICSFQHLNDSWLIRCQLHLCRMNERFVACCNSVTSYESPQVMKELNLHQVRNFTFLF